MPSTPLSRLAQLRVTLAYTVVLVVVTATLARLGPEVEARVVGYVSTNLHNLSRGRVDTLIGSALVVDAEDIAVWLPGLICLLAVGELLWRSGRLVIAFLVGHVGATLVVALGLAVAVHVDWLPGDVAEASDVGMSYGAMGVLGSLTPAIPQRWRGAWIGWWFATGMAAVVVGMDFTSAGHLVALALGMLVAMRFGPPHRWTWARVAILGVGASLGYLILIGSDGPFATATVAGVGGAALGAGVTLQRRGRGVPRVTPDPSL